MKSYFEQFGTVTRVRLSRSKKTGHSKHYAFVEFASSDVAKIVAETMNTYLMYGRSLRCKVVPKEQVHESLWIGANKRFKAVPWNKIEGRKLKLPKARSEWTKKINDENKRRVAKSKKLLESMGYVFEMPKVKGVESVPVRTKQIEGPQAEAIEQTLAVTENEQGLVVAEEAVTKKVKKSKKKNEDLGEGKHVEQVTDEIDPGSIASKPKKKAKKSKGPAKEEALSIPAQDEAEPTIKQSKKAKNKAKVEDITQEAQNFLKVVEKPSKEGKEADGAVSAPAVKADEQTTKRSKRDKSKKAA